MKCAAPPGEWKFSPGPNPTLWENGKLDGSGFQLPSCLKKLCGLNSFVFKLTEKKDILLAIPSFSWKINLKKIVILQRSKLQPPTLVSGSVKKRVGIWKVKCRVSSQAFRNCWLWSACPAAHLCPSGARASAPSHRCGRAAGKAGPQGFSFVRGNSNGHLHTC